jgi:hypothetical protein
MQRRTGSRTLAFTQDFIAGVLGTGRASVSVAVSLQNAGLSITPPARSPSAPGDGCSVPLVNATGALKNKADLPKVRHVHPL